MFKIGFVFLFAVFVACNCYEDSQVEDSEKQEDVISEERAGQTAPSELGNDEGMAEDDGFDGDDDTLIDVSENEG